MPRYYLNLRYGLHLEKLALDPEGDDLADESLVREHGLRAARLNARTRSDSVRHWLDCLFEITDAQGRHVLTLPFSDIVSEES